MSTMSSKELESLLDGDAGLTLVTARRKRKKQPTEAEIKMEAYFIWERSGKTRDAQSCWFEAKKNLGAE